jgi:hypothetical protein
VNIAKAFAMSSECVLTHSGIWWRNPEHQERLMELAGAMKNEPSIFGANGHLKVKPFDKGHTQSGPPLLSCSKPLPRSVLEHLPVFITQSSGSSVGAHWIYLEQGG